MGGCCTKKRQVAPDLEQPEYDFDLRAKAQHLPRLKFCGDCGQKREDNQKPCEKCGQSQSKLRDLADPDKAVHVAPAGGWRKNQASLDAAEGNSLPKKTRKDHPALLEPALRYQTAAWADSLSGGDGWDCPAPEPVETKTCQTQVRRFSAQEGVASVAQAGPRGASLTLAQQLLRSQDPSYKGESFQAENAPRLAKPKPITMLTSCAPKPPPRPKTMAFESDSNELPTLRPLGQEKADLQMKGLLGDLLSGPVPSDPGDSMDGRRCVWN